MLKSENALSGDHFLPKMLFPKSTFRCFHNKPRKKSFPSSIVIDNKNSNSMSVSITRKNFSDTAYWVVAL